MSAVAGTSEQKIVMINAPGGYGKTFLLATILAAVRAQGQIALAVAPTGLAAENLEGGRTAHSRFKIPIPITDTSMCRIPAQSHLAALIRRTKVIVWDEIMATHRHAVECVDRTMQDLRNSEQPFGGCIALFGGDTRQILPVVRHGSEAAIMDSSIKRSPLWAHCTQLPLTINMRVNSDEVEFSNFLLQIGNGQHDTVDPTNTQIMEIPAEFIEPNLASLIKKIFPNLQDGYQDPYFMAHRSILTPLNEHMDKINTSCVQSFPGIPRTYLSADKVQEDNGNLAIPLEYLNSLTPSGMPPHQLILKLNMVVMLLRNLQAGPSEGLRNGTRLLIKSLGNHMIEAEILTGTSTGTTVFLPRIPFHLRDSDFPFIMIRKQFPIRPCFSMTINKAQGQTLDKVGIYLPNPVFTHGQLYVAFSRVRTKHALAVCIDHQQLTQMASVNNNHCTSNIVFHSIL
ncbi:ATP-dependent DNA helicase pif1-like [Amphiura filiformis]|uniref:ATP-dependent DNA helicase pif1-like n=1 Tax=Amphiura filiformis TaxID=82378 RepID=UPI003B2152D8